MTTDRRSSAAAAASAAEQRRDALSERLFEGLLAGLELLSVHLGTRLGLYEALSDGGSASRRALAERASIHPRYAREWLEQQAAAGLVEVDADHADGYERSYRLPEGHAEVLLDRDSPAYAAAAPLALHGLAGVFADVVSAYATGAGVAFAAQGVEVRQSIAGINRPMFVNDLGTSWIPSIAALHERLQADPPARVLDLGCGTGWSSIALARAYPKARIHAIDLDPASIAEARTNAEAAGVEARINFEVTDGAGLAATEPYDLVCIFEALHDMAHPVEVLRSVRAALAAGGSLLLADERVADTFEAPSDFVERFQYAWSVLHCLPATRAEEPSVEAGTMLRAPTLREYAREAGFSSVEEPPIENDFWRFYHLRR